MFWRKRKEKETVTLNCLRCDHKEEWFPEVMRHWPEMLCEICNSPLTLACEEGSKPSLTIRPARPPVTKKGGSNMPEDKDPLQIKIDVDTSQLDAAIEKAKELNDLTKDYEDRAKHKDDALDPIAMAAAAMRYIQDTYGPDKKEKLLVIELDDIHSVPRVVHHGKEVNMLKGIGLHWKTSYEEGQPVVFHIEHFDEDDRCFKNFGSSK